MSSAKWRLYYICLNLIMNDNSHTVVMHMYVLPSRGPAPGVGGMCPDNNNRKTKNASRIVMMYDILSPDSSGMIKTKADNKANKTVGKTRLNTWYRGCLRSRRPNHVDEEWYSLFSINTSVVSRRIPADSMLLERDIYIVWYKAYI